MGRKLDRSQPFGEVIGSRTCKYEQGGMAFNLAGDQVDENGKVVASTPAPAPAANKVPEKKVAPKKAATKKKAAPKKKVAAKPKATKPKVAADPDKENSDQVSAALSED